MIVLVFAETILASGTMRVLTLFVAVVVASPLHAQVPASNIALTLTLYVVLYVSLLVAYVTVLKYMAEKSEAVLETEAEERNRQPPGIATSPVVGPTSP